MELLIALLVAALGGMFFYKRKADSATTDSKLAETKGRDAEKAAQQAEIENALKALDEGIEQMKKEKQERNNQDKSDEEVAANLNKNLK